MPAYETIAYVLMLAVVGVPLALLVLLGFASLIQRPLSELAISRLVAASICSGLLAACGVGGIMLFLGEPHWTVEVGQWVQIPHYHFSIKLLFDALSLPMVILSFVLCGTVGAFTTRYLHREPGFNRFFVLYALFVLGMVVTSLAGTIETLFTGWELVGLSSALLVAFFHERLAPVQNGLRVWSVYRVSDAALLTAAVLLHHVRGEGDFDALLGMGAWPTGEASISQQQALLIGALMLLAAAGKSALVPFSGWLPRAMEGPTPSSAIFYGSLSVHLGAYLLLRISPILDVSPWLSALVVATGLATALLGTIAARVQTDIKCALAFSSVTQVGIIVAEIGLGLRWLALAHMIGHGCLRTLQFLRAPSLIYDYHHLENALGTRLPRTAGFWVECLPSSCQRWLYRFALEQGYLDALLDTLVVRPFLGFFHYCEAIERRWMALLSGEPISRTKPSSMSVSSYSRSFQELMPPHLHDEPNGSPAEADFHHAALP